MCEVLSIVRECNPGAAGLTCMYLIGIEDIISIPQANEDWVIEDDILIKPGAGFKKIIFREQSAGLSDELMDAIGGGFRKNLGLKIFKYGSQSNKWIYNMIGARFIALIEDFSGQVILVGNLTNPMRLEKATGKTGEKISDETGWQVNLMADTPKPCYLYEGGINIAGEPAINFIAYWGWQAAPFTPVSLPLFNFQKAGVFTVKGAISADYMEAPLNQYLALKYPVTETEKLNWFNSSWNYGVIPDQAFNITFTDGVFNYAYTRLKLQLSATNKKIIYTSQDNAFETVASLDWISKQRGSIRNNLPGYGIILETK